MVGRQNADVADSLHLRDVAMATTFCLSMGYNIGCMITTSVSMSSLFYLLVWSPPPHIPYISSPNQCLFFAAHAHTIATCFVVVSILYHLFLVFLSTPYLELLYLNITHPSDHSYLCSLKCHLIFFPDRPGLTFV